MSRASANDRSRGERSARDRSRPVAFRIGLRVGSVSFISFVLG